MTQATPTAPRDTRPTVAGFVLPWDVAVPNDTGFLDVIDAEGAHVAIVDGSDSFVLGLTTDVNAQGARIAALEAALIQVVTKFHEATVEATGEIRMEVEAADDHVRDIMEGLGLAKDLWGNPAKAEQVTA